MDLEDSVNQVPFRVLHMDLKGCVPPIRRLLRQLEICRAAHFNAVLMEWEDMFPWKNPEMRSEVCYTEEEIRLLGRKCRELGLEVIPLVQSLGHLENVLSLPVYADMRELPEDAGCLNVLHPRAGQLIRGLLEEVLALLPELHFLHLGGDEASSFGKSPAAREFIARHSAADLYLSHILPLAEFLQSRSIRPLLWGDMMVDWPEEALKKLLAAADLVLWGYQGKASQNRKMAKWDWLQVLKTCGGNLWGGCAYKGADGFNAACPVLNCRVENTLDWIDSARHFGMRGLIATGWSRYSTTRPQCETLEASLLSLAVVGRLLDQGRSSSQDEEEALQLLRNLGEYDCFTRVTDIMKKIDAIMEGYQLVFRQLIATCCSRTVRNITGADWYVDFFLKDMRQALQNFRELRPEFEAAMDGLLIPSCAVSYFKERELILVQDLRYAESLARR